VQDTKTDDGSKAEFGIGSGYGEKHSGGGAEKDAALLAPAIGALQRDPDAI